MKKLTLLIGVFAMSSLLSFAQTNDSKKVLVDQYGVTVNSEQVKATAQNGILVLSSTESPYKLWFDARVNVDGAFFFGDGEDLEPIGDGFSIRRARFGVKAQVLKDWYGEIDMDMADGVFELKDAYVRYDGINNMQVQVGTFKEFFSMQRNTSSRNLMLIERAFVNSAFSPSRSVGINFKYAKDWLWASGGYFGQEIKDLETRALVEDNNKDFGHSEGSTYNLKLALRPLYNSKTSGLIFAGAISHRTPKTSEGIDDNEDWEYGAVRYSCRATTSINRKKYTDTNVIFAENETRYALEFTAYHRGLRFESAIEGTKVNVDGARMDEYLSIWGDGGTEGESEEILYNKEDKNFWGGYVQASYLLFGGQQRYDADGNKMTRPTRGKDWGDLEIAARFDYIDLNDELGLVYGGSAKAYSLGLNYYVNRQVKLMLNYQYTDQDEYANGKSGKYDVGYNAAGDPIEGKDLENDFIIPGNTPDADHTIVGKKGIDFGMIAFRVQIAF